MRKLVPTLLSNAADFGGGGCAAAPQTCRWAWRNPAGEIRHEPVPHTFLTPLRIWPAFAVAIAADGIRVLLNASYRRLDLEAILKDLGA